MTRSSALSNSPPNARPDSRPSLAVIGSGIAGLSAAYHARHDYQVTLYEAQDRLGGHAHTHHVCVGGTDVAVDTGFIVHNRRTYPVLTGMFAELGVETKPSQMSLSVRSDVAGVEYAGARKFRGLFPHRGSIRWQYLRMLAAIPRFHRMARRCLNGDANDTETLGEFLERGEFSSFFVRHFVTPLIATVWSADPATASWFPAQYLFRFLHNHGMLQVFGSPQWRTVAGGSGQYVGKIAATLGAFGGTIRCSSAVTAVRRSGDGIEVTDATGAIMTYDSAVIATHPQGALAVLVEPSDEQIHALTAFRYTRNPAQLHTDESLLPRSPHAQASWNYLETSGSTGLVVTYDMNRLMGLECRPRLLVTLNGDDLVDASAVIATMEYDHPIYTPDALAAQRSITGIETDRLVFAGAWHGWGFHEDGARAGRDAIKRLGGRQPASAPATPTPSLYATQIHHQRRTPVLHSFGYRSHIWLVDIDDLPDHGLLGTFRARDHLGEPDASIRQNIEAFLFDHGIGQSPARILMAANARAFGYCFNPISIFWCYDAGGLPVATIIEVHNTYKDRHAYLIHPDERGRATVAKAMYVSPFHGTEGTYDISVPEPGDDMRISIRLSNPDGSIFTASMNGRRTTGAAVWRAAPSALINSARIRVQGIALWFRRVPIHPRPEGKSL